MEDNSSGWAGLSIGIMLGWASAIIVAFIVSKL